MSSAMEQRYRNVLRLLPAGYRQQWEEDMVSAYMESTKESGGRRRSSFGERRSVLALALRVRLDGSHASPRGQVWYQAAYGLSLIILLYQAVAGAAASVTVFEVLARSVVDQPFRAMLSQYWQNYFLLLAPLVGLLWVAVFSCAVLRRFSAARILALITLVASAATTITTFAIVSRFGADAPPFDLVEVGRWIWLAISVFAALPAPVDIRPSRRLWFGLFAAAVIVSVPILLWHNIPYGQWFRLGLVNVATAALIVAMAVALRRVFAGPGHSPSWLLALAVAAGGIGGVRLLRMLPLPSSSLPVTGAVEFILNATLVGLALIGAIVGLVVLRQRPNSADQGPLQPA